MMQRRVLLGGMALASGGPLLPSAAAIADQSTSSTGVVGVKDPQFGAIGNFQIDETKAIQAAADKLGNKRQRAKRGRRV